LYLTAHAICSSRVDNLLAATIGVNSSFDHQQDNYEQSDKAQKPFHKFLLTAKTLEFVGRFRTKS